MLIADGSVWCLNQIFVLVSAMVIADFCDGDRGGEGDIGGEGGWLKMGAIKHSNEIHVGMFCDRDRGFLRLRSRIRGVAVGIIWVHPCMIYLVGCCDKPSVVYCRSKACDRDRNVNVSLTAMHHDARNHFGSLRTFSVHLLVVGTLCSTCRRNGNGLQTSPA